MVFSRSMARRHRAPRRSQRGIVMAITLISLVLLLIGLAAMLRNVDSSSMVVGNLAFRRDLTNRAEQAVLAAKTALALSTLDTTANTPGSNYVSYRLAETNGMPTVLLSDSGYSGAGYTSVTGTDGITLRWVIDRQCLATGTFDTGTCEFVTSTGDTGGSSFLKKPGGSTKAVYRISVRATGPRGAEAYFQTTYSY